ncbi:hypothetical protein FNV43_RR17070 [Rhamnella rubrinervis]|uniref:Uncharacterized protein n=1 Tax=Rhamnella rubrinervis TaxID=2594499 RepID=A0A8K0MD38_9ROSA|nr:hypothetical protein FNV43_RR17070 [Rhamnella rubrinervis]
MAAGIQLWCRICALLTSFPDRAIGSVDDALGSLERVIMGFPSLIVQSTQGISQQCGVYTWSSDMILIWCDKRLALNFSLLGIEIFRKRSPEQEK